MLPGSNPGSPDLGTNDNQKSITVAMHGSGDLDETMFSNRIALPQVEDHYQSIDAGDQDIVDSNVDNCTYWEGVNYEPESDAEILFQYDSTQAAAAAGTNECESLNLVLTGNGFVDHAYDLQLAEEINKSGKFNFQEVRVPINTQWNTELLEQLLEGYHDKQVAELLRYGWPVDRNNDVPLPEISGRNHKGATEFPDHIDKYIDRELKLGALAGPFDKIPMEGFCCSPLNSRPKQSGDQRRVIMDLSWEPGGASVNAGIDKYWYLNEPVKLRYPTVWTLIRRIKQLAEEGDETILMYKRDWARAFSQLGLDPGSYRLIGFVWRGKYYFSKVVPMGLVSACFGMSAHH